EDVVDLAGQVHYGVAGHVVGQGAAGPGEHQGGGVAGADRGADLLLVGVVGEELHGERVVGVVLVPGVEGGLVGVLLRAGERPDGQARRGAGATGGLLPASAGAEP